MDTAVASLGKVLASGEYVEIPDVPVFDVHTVYDAQGKAVKDYDEAEIRAIVDTSNRRLAATGDLAPIGPGHTVDGLPETMQPPVWGFAGKFRVDKFGPQRKTGILCSYFVKRENLDKVRGFPRRSIELWIKDKVIDWVALLRRTPLRDLGLLTFAKDDAGPGLCYPAEPWFYDPQRGRPVVAHVSPSGKLRYAMEADDMPDPTQPPSKTDPDAEFTDKVMKCVKQAFPGLAEMCQKFAAAGPGMGGPNAVAPPGAAGAVPPDDKLRMEKAQADIVVARYQKELDDLRGEVASGKREAKLARFERQFVELEAQGYAFDRAEEMAEVAALDDAQFGRYVERVKKRYQKAPVGGGLLPVAGNVLASQPGGTTRDQRDAAVKLATARGISFDAALVEVKKQ